ncbi:class 1 fructose-bisphosphatase [Halobacteriales archaeon Cl-PHB]
MADPVDAIFATVAETAEDVRSALAERRAYDGAENPSGEQQLAADVYADDLLEERLLTIDAVGGYASEEREQDVLADDGGTFHVACDPLDGSSNLKSNNGMGTIVGVYDRELPAPGDSLVAAGYVLYGPITTMVEARDGTVTEYLLRDGQREVLNEDVQLPEEPVVYGFGGRVPDWTDDFRTYVDDVEADRLKLRYGGAMVADVNQVVEYGGIFGYPMLEGTPEGKLRLQFEGHPIGYVIETAGGASSDGERSLLDREPGELHERTPVFVGNGSLIDRLEDELA